ncbi:hypothetical protein B0I72DRAFT_99794 [Yarrowia lipolytica]|uniref:YALI0A06017p n=3 Tax=Yarrowia lipolytica TaxID=4952 RepID=Q6CHR3_YARLI|nr:YALI0A06017p [Yarrowia lipolytica CLIB122]KAB8284149.1 hypothetical protein BKA91DRAFT_161536 [Yarrowia lipolytica]KAE8173062.1 hypothetical protein BKA90DRAFT_173578 [Yarrowia lipolytica]KAJ8051404.1 hypothetical protein LXG23DRAFT_50991 [Yarrowia lipolytica]RDW22681.1 hypothetical protein B0I71DRAFT_169636 [Yarrowia lipolytica]RDW31533.1 hypothetical protein B0I72DRAFT_99794 [Yarrowia lipolytica]|eukprot:XP_499798.2 YALI0A06017p [Yarrowia lipolytica CLIB122]
MQTSRRPTTIPLDDMVYPNHLPGSAGFQIKRFLAAHNVSPYLGYIEPTEDLRHIIFVQLHVRMLVDMMEETNFTKNIAPPTMVISTIFTKAVS